MKQMYITCLQQELIQVFGHPVLAFSDCSKLVEEIFEKTGSRLSVNTLRRFFNLIIAKYPPSYNTLTILSKACGFHSFDEFRSICDRKKNQTNNPDPTLLRFMVSLFQQTPVMGVNDESFNSIVRLTIIYLKSNQEIIDTFQKEIARTKNGQAFYFERFINIDYLNSFYGNGIRYYLNEKRDNEAQLFGYSLLCFRDWLTKDDPAFDFHYKQVEQYTPSLSMSPGVQARHFSAKLFYTHIHGLPAAPVLEDARYAFNQLSASKEHTKGFARFEFIFSAALVLTHHFEEASFYLAQTTRRKHRHSLSDEETALFKDIEVYEALALAALGERAKAETLYARLKTARFYFLERKYMSILFMHLEQLLKRKSFRQEKRDFLVQDTGFIRLQDLFSIR
jgi:hypothetical protein